MKFQKVLDGSHIKYHRISLVLLLTSEKTGYVFIQHSTTFNNHSLNES